MQKIQIIRRRSHYLASLIVVLTFVGCNSKKLLVPSDSIFADAFSLTSDLRDDRTRAMFEEHLHLNKVEEGLYSDLLPGMSTYPRTYNGIDRRVLGVAALFEWGQYTAAKKIIERYELHSIDRGMSVLYDLILIVKKVQLTENDLFFIKRFLSAPDLEDLRTFSVRSFLFFSVITGTQLSPGMKHILRSPAGVDYCTTEDVRLLPMDKTVSVIFFSKELTSCLAGSICISRDLVANNQSINASSCNEWGKTGSLLLERSQLKGAYFDLLRTHFEGKP